MLLIPTVRKEVLPKGFSYPVGAESISAAIAGTPQFEELQLWFSWRDEFWASRYATKLNAKGVLRLIEVSNTLRFSEWSVRLHAIPSDHKAAAREQLLAVGLPALRRKLIDAGDRVDSFSCVASYDLGSSMLATQ